MQYSFFLNVRMFCELKGNFPDFQLASTLRRYKNGIKLSSDLPVLAEKLFHMMSLQRL